MYGVAAMHRGQNRRPLVLGAPLLWAALCSAEPAWSQVDDRPAIVRCREFCGRVYAENRADYDECALACGEADACHRSCKEKLGTDRPRIQKCLRACMRRNEEAEQPAAKPLRL